MFEIPNAKRVRRQDLYSRSPSPSPSPSTPDSPLRARLQQQYEAAYQLPHSFEGAVSPAVSHRSPTPAAEDLAAQIRDEEAFEFRLFSKPGSGDQAPVKPSRILIRSPSPVIGEPGFLQPRRSDKYYFATTPTCEQRACFEAAAISADAIVAEQAHKWPGCALPWRVTTITAPAARSSSALAANLTGISTKRKRVGKKRRIILRKELALVREKEAIRSMTAAEREAVEREKRTKRNREKKVKKKERDKLKKAAEPSAT
ncbi:hypothetical protein MMC30_000763 [Trapelia coarctata]|nr:hypothetical protein [Trapelia coarctata]